eukprot:6036691-Pyramimonas_sp.AAC.1
MSQAIRWFQHSKGSGGRVVHSAPFAGCCGDVPGGLAIFSSNMVRFRSRFGGRPRPVCGDVSGGLA